MYCSCLILAITVNAACSHVCTVVAKREMKRWASVPCWQTWISAWWGGGGVVPWTLAKFCLVLWGQNASIREVITISMRRHSYGLLVARCNSLPQHSAAIVLQSVSAGHCALSALVLWLLWSCIGGGHKGDSWTSWSPVLLVGSVGWSRKSQWSNTLSRSSTPTQPPATWSQPCSPIKQ